MSMTEILNGIGIIDDTENVVTPRSKRKTNGSDVKAVPVAAKSSTTKNGLRQMGDARDAAKSPHRSG